MKEELITTGVTAVLAAFGFLARRYSWLAKLADVLRKASDVADDIVDEVEEDVRELATVLDQQRLAYDHLRERYDEVVSALEDERVQQAILAEALSVAVDHIDDLTGEE